MTTRSSQEPNPIILYGTLAGITLVGLFLRIYELGRLSLAFNEDYLAITSASILEDFSPDFPSGLLYVRALPLSYLAALSVKVLGFSELSLRLPSALSSVLAVPLMYFLGRGLLGWGFGLLASLLMAISSWEIEVGRTARMYAMLILFCLLSLHLAFQVCAHDRTGLKIPAILSSCLACLLHQLAGILVISYAFFAYIFWKEAPRRNFLILNLILTLAVALGDRELSKRNLSDFRELAAEERDSDEPSGAQAVRRQSKLSIFETRYLPLFQRLREKSPVGFATLSLLAVGGTAGAAIFLRSRKADWRFILFLAAIALCVLAQQIALAAYLFCACLYLNGEGLRGLGRRRFLALALLVPAGGALWLGLELAFLGTFENLSTIPALKSSVRAMTYPPNFLEFFLRSYPLECLLALPGGILLFHRCSTGKAELGERVLFFLFLIPMAAMAFHPYSLVRFYQRYAYFLNPYLLMFIAYSALQAASAVNALLDSRRGVPGIAAALAVVLILIGGSGARKTLGVVQMRHGVNPGFIDEVGESAFYPDHRGPSLFVKENFRPGDVVIAQDALGHYAYFPVLHYQLTPNLKGDAEGWLAAESLRTPEELRKALADNRGNRIWIVLSGQKLLFYEKDPTAREMLGIIEGLDPEKPFTGDDGLSAVLLLGNR